MSERLYCTFCGKNNDEVRKLIAGPTVFICDECVDLCHSITHGQPPPEEKPDLLGWVEPFDALEQALAVLRSTLLADAQKRRLIGPAEIVKLPEAPR